MNIRVLRLVVAAGVAAVWCCGCALWPGKRLTPQTGESVVFVGEEPAGLAWLPSRSAPLRVRSTYERGPDTVEYVAGRDFTVDYAAGTLRRIPG